MKVVKSEWHQVEKRYEIEITEDLIREVYADDEDELEIHLKAFEEGVLDPIDVVDYAEDSGFDLGWEWTYDDCWTDRKGGYDVTYAIEDGEE